MSFTAYTTNPGSGGTSLASQSYSGQSYLAGVTTYGPDGGPFTLVGINSPFPVSLGDGQKVTYAIGGSVSLAAAPSDVIELNNSAGTKTIKITRVCLSGSAGTAVLVPLNLIKRSTLNTSGTSSTPTPVPFDSSDAAATGIVKVYTVNPTTGTAVGTVRSVQYNMPLSGNINVVEWRFGVDASNRAITLRANQSLVVNLGGTSISSGVLYYDISWTEE